MFLEIQGICVKSNHGCISVLCFHDISHCVIWLDEPFITTFCLLESFLFIIQGTILNIFVEFHLLYPIPLCPTFNQFLKTENQDIVMQHRRQVKCKKFMLLFLSELRPWYPQFLRILRIKQYKVRSLLFDPQVRNSQNFLIQ